MDQPTAPLRRGARADEPREPDVGETFGPWLTVKRLAAGGFGTVFEARHTSTGARAALKLLHAKFVTSAEVLARFEREVHIIQTLDHPAVVGLLDAGFSTDGRPYLCMELLDGEPLSAMIHRRGKLPPSEVVAIMAPLCDALAAAHELGIVHRDVKASNVVCGDRVMLLDFGIAKISDAFAMELTATNQSLGTPGSMAPEQILGRPVDGRTDVYALGCLAFHMLTGRIPFVDDSETMIQHLHLHARRPKASDITSVPDGVDDVLARAMALEASNRFSDPNALLAALTACLGGGSTASDHGATLHGVAPTPVSKETARHTPRQYARAGTAALEPGRRIAQYELVRELGRGGMGVVYVARDVKLGRKVAMKFLRHSSREVADRFLIEARATAQCSHDNIVIIHEVDEIDSTPYMVLEYLEGGDLRKSMAGERVSPARTIELALPIARALARAHSQGIIHRDLKPENVFVTTAGQVKVLDFGIAKAIEIDPTKTPPLGIDSDRMMLTGAGALIGTLPYIAPEQVCATSMSDGVDYRSDLYALGVIMFELLAGEHPVQPLTRDALFANLFDAAPMRSVLELAPETPPALAEIVAACLEKSKQQRIASASELVARLEGLLPTAESISGIRQTLAPPRARPSRRRGFLVLGLAALAIGAATSWFLVRANRRPTDDDRRLDEMFQLAQRGDHVKAAPLVEEYLGQHPGDVDALALQVLIAWWSSGTLGEREIAISPRLPPRQRAMAHGIALMTQRFPEKAIAHLEKADRDHPDASEIVYVLGEAYWHGGRIERGVATLERAFRLDPRWQTALHHVLEYRLERGETAQVKPIVEMLRTVDPAAAAALDCRVAIAERRYVDAARDVASAIARLEPLPDLYSCQVQAHLLAGELAAAERIVKAATDRALDLREWGGLALEGELLLYRGRFDAYLEFTRGKSSVQRTLTLALWDPKSELTAGMRTVGLSTSGMRQAPLAMVAWILTSERVPAEFFADNADPEVGAFGRGTRAELRGDRAAAIIEYRKVIATPAKGDLRMLAAHHLARALRDSGDTAGAATACKEVIAPRVYQGYRALLLPDCQLWSDEPAQWKRLIETWQGSFAHPAVVETRRLLAGG